MVSRSRRLTRIADNEEEKQHLRLRLQIAEDDVARLKARETEVHSAASRLTHALTELTRHGHGEEAERQAIRLSRAVAQLSELDRHAIADYSDLAARLVASEAAYVQVCARDSHRTQHARYSLGAEFGESRRLEPDLRQRRTSLGVLRTCRVRDPAPNEKRLGSISCNLIRSIGST